MSELQQLIRQYPELGDAFADFETRLLFLENSLPLEFPEEPPDEEPEPQLEDHFYIHRRNVNVSIDPRYTSTRLYKRVENLEAQIVALKKLLNIKASASKRKHKDII